MCCDICYKYEECEENGKLRDDCCSKCSEYNECVTKESREKDNFGDSQDHISEEDYS
ncbi:MAG: hypothetical protein ISS45_01870 [Candidatus Omnitrophica bacterium]|nr:hypothetical protein [Candidatus Omnitrophota bacterium]